MITIGILGDETGSIATALREALRTARRETPEIRAAHESETRDAYDVLVIDAAKPDGSRWNAAAKAFVINSDVAGIVKSLPELAPPSPELVMPLIITYGFNARACVTASSISEHGCEICIQRSFTDLFGFQHNQREFSFACDSAGTALAAATAALAAGYVIY